MSATDESGEWLIYRGAANPTTASSGCPTPALARLPPPRGSRTTETRRLGAYRDQAVSLRPEAEELEVINAALYLRRPLLVTGGPGVGKSSLAHSVADELGLGDVLRWPVVSRSTLQDGLYHYDAIARLQDVQIAAHSGTATEPGAPGSVESIGDYLRLGPSAPPCSPVNCPACCSSTSSTRATSTCPTTS
ncbi:hypothetical protein ACFQVA_29355 [Actinomadura keratinilytica]